MISTMRSGSYVALLLLSASCLLTASTHAANPPTTQPDNQVVAEFKMEHWGELILIPVDFGGKSAFFMLDSGFTFNAINLADFPKLEPIGTGDKMDSAGGAVALQKFLAPNLHIGPVSLADSGPVLGLDFSIFSAVAGRPIIGALGTKGMKDFIVQIDSDEHKVRFLRPDHKLHEEWGNSFDMRLDKNDTPSIEVTIENVKQSLQVDTGSEDCVDLPTALFDRLYGLNKGPIKSSPLATANGVVEVRETRIPSVEIAGLHYHDLLYSEWRAPFAAVGLGFLERHLATLDFPDSRLYLKAAKEFDHRVERNMAGIHALRFDNQLVAKIVDEGSPAYAAGVREGDILLDLNGKPAGDYGMPEFRDLVSAGDGRELTVTFSHAGSRKTVAFKLRSTI